MAEATPPDTGGEMETIASADGTEITFERTGSGPPLVLVHGGVCDHRFCQHGLAVDIVLTGRLVPSEFWNVSLIRRSHVIHIKLDGVDSECFIAT